MNGLSDRSRRTLLPLIVLGILCGAVLTALAGLTEDRIEANRRQAALHAVRDILPRPHNNDPLQADRTLTGPGLPGTGDTVIVYTAGQGREGQGLVFLPVTARGYRGPIRLAVGVARDGTLTGVRVLEQDETEGLGAAVDQEESDWIRQFTGQSLDSVPPAEWAVREEAGRFDGLSGATVTSRGVINAVRQTLEYYERHKDRLLEDQD